MSGKHSLKKALSLILCLLLALPIALPAVAVASPASSSTEDTVVRVGWYHSALFQEGMEDGERKSGYSYEYLQKISDYNGWKYEYVYGDWSELLPMLQKGKIDVMAGVSQTAEREKYMSFPSYSMGTDKYVLYQHADNRTMDISDIDSFKGKKVGAVNNNRMTTFLEQWAKENDAKIDIVYYDGFDERDADFASGKLDGVVATDNNIQGTDNYSQVVKVGEEPFYLAVTKKRTDLLRQLNYALGTIQEMDPYFQSNLLYANYGTLVTSATLTDSEAQWVAEHQTLTMGYLNDYLPYCSTDGMGDPKGLITDVMSAMLEKLGISDQVTVKYQGYDSNAAMISALKAGEVDAIFPVGGELWDLEQQDIHATSAVVTSNMCLVYKGVYSDSAASAIAVNANNELQISFTKRVFPDATLVSFDSIEECIGAVKSGKATGTVINGLRLDLVHYDISTNELSSLQLSETDTRRIGVNDTDTALLLLLNRGLQLVGRDYGISASYAYMSDLYDVSAADFFQRYFGQFALAALIILLVILFLLARNAANARRSAAEQAHLNKQLAAATKRAEAANEAKTSFLFNMSHDIRTPMNAIIGFTDLLDKHQDDPEKREDYLAKIKESNEVLLSIINNVLEMARVESGAVVVEEAPEDIKKAADEMYLVFADLMEGKNIELSYELKVQHFRARCDIVKIRAVLLNILSNAYKYTESGGRVSAVLEELPDGREGWSLYRTTISDTGIGMSEDFLPHLFDSFSREHSTTECKVEGTGLGMPIVKKLVELMNGTINVESKQGVGTTFVVEIPLRYIEDEEVDSAQAAGVADKDFDAVGKRILLTEDNDLNAEIATEILKEYGFEIDRAADGVECLEMLEAADSDYYDVVLMDVQMPRMNGYEATRSIRALDDPDKADIPILAMTANAFAEDRRAAIEAGMDGHIAKPIDVPVLLSTLKAVIS